MVKIAEIFTSTQGEGRNAGAAAIFIRLSGCNLKCPFCDTDHSGDAMKEQEVANLVMDLRKDADINLVIFTGGEPSLQLDSMKSIIEYMRAKGYEGTFAVESNGTCPPRRFREIGVEFVTISPKVLWVDNKAASQCMDTWVDASEIKCLYDTTKDEEELRLFLNSIANAVENDSREGSIKPFLYLQPITDHNDSAMTDKNIQAVLTYITRVDSRWKISMQLQNIWKVR